MFPYGKTVTVIRPPELNKYGVPVGSETETDIDGCAWAPRVGGPGTSSADITQRGRQGVIEGLTLYAPHGSDIRHTDQVQIPGEGLFEVDGEAGTWENPFTGSTPGMEIALRRAAG